MLKRGSRVTSALFLAQSLLISSIAVPVYATDIYGYETYNEETQLGNGESDGVIRDFAASENESPDDEYENEPSPKAVADETGNSQVGNDDAESDKSGVGDSDNDLISVDAAGSDNAGADEAGTSDVSMTADESSMYTAEDMQAITDELKQKEEEPEENDLSPAVEKRLESQEEVLVGKPAATDVRNCADTGAFAQALSDINIDYPCDKVGEIAIDLKEGLITDENGEELIGADSSVLAAAEEREADAATEILEENGYKDVTCENGVISADDRYATARLFVMSSVPIDTRGALSVVSFGETYLVQYATPAEAAIAAEMLKDDEGVWEVMPDVVITVDSLEIPESDEILESEANSESGESHLWKARKKNRRSCRKTKG